jgi:hypothetical protein
MAHIRGIAIRYRLATLMAGAALVLMAAVGPASAHPGASQHRDGFRGTSAPAVHDQNLTTADENSDDQGADDQADENSDDQGADDQGADDQGAVDENSDDQGAVDENSDDQGSDEQGSDDQGSDEQGSDTGDERD